jgi:DNA-binding IclR family transcriptional regulator
MQSENSQGQIAARVKAINLTIPQLARIAGLAPSTVYRGTRTVKRLEKLTSALAQEELRLRDHLLALHPLEPDEERKSACG